jgi:hypothetical protein
VDEHKIHVLEEARAELNNVLPILPGEKCYKRVAKAIDNIDGVLQAVELEQSADSLEGRTPPDNAQGATRDMDHLQARGTA